METNNNPGAQPVAADMAKECEAFAAWFDRAYPADQDGRRPDYRNSPVMGLMLSAWQARASLATPDAANSSKPGKLTDEQLGEIWMSVMHIEHATQRQTAFARAIEAALQTPAVPEGWKLVPVEPTDEMVAAVMNGAAYNGSMANLMLRGIARNWSAMLAAAPVPPCIEARLANTNPAAHAGNPPGWERGIATVTMTGHQLREALEFINPGGDDDPDERDNDLTFGVVKHKDDDGKVSTGLCCWNDDTDGVLPLDGEYSRAAAPVPPASAPAGTINGQPVIGQLLDDFSELPLLWGLNEPGALVRHSDVFKMLVDAGKAMDVAAIRALRTDTEGGA